ncbi:dolichol-phosphate mannosyltransferase [Hymenobacter luteus]|uniref:Dolichol-phosphate mannosyltransferase n=2 Tax=Hymenobacter TaxID=89966 RepID=A0A7W9WCJ3_9BACT|nr:MULTISPECIES: glycosyltransferase family 2 protein [Hymenobacter]MBB4603215.1 dolichol-phosphate mannosyltransferase [Hymenobacter latericoloratus]MBB6060113.1 dolichol-phosphate mannosyltransferase [Hymenobacter luteus]
MDLSVVIPIYNEEANIHALYHRLRGVLAPMQVAYELIFINDGSRDRSLELIRELAAHDPQVRYADFSRNFGHQIAVTAGLDVSGGEAVVIIDADLQDPPELIPALYAKLQEGYEVVYAKRRTRQGESAAKLLTAKLFYRLLASITHISIPVDTGDFRIVSRKVVAALRQMPEQNKFIRGQISWIGYRQTYLEYDRAERAGGATGYTYSKMIRLALDGITGFSDAPLKAATLSGFLVSGVAFLVMLYTLYARFISGDYQPGWASLMISILFLGGVQLIAVGIIGEYIARLSANVRQRPLYIISDTNVGGVHPPPHAAPTPPASLIRSPHES